MQGKRSPSKSTHENALYLVEIITLDRKTDQSCD